MASQPTNKTTPKEQPNHVTKHHQVYLEGRLQLCQLFRGPAARRGLLGERRALSLLGNVLSGWGGGGGGFRVVVADDDDLEEEGEREEERLRRQERMGQKGGRAKGGFSEL